METFANREELIIAAYAINFYERATSLLRKVIGKR